jgi:hypothetical protein
MEDLCARKIQNAFRTYSATKRISQLIERPDFALHQTEMLKNLKTSNLLSRSTSVKKDVEPYAIKLQRFWRVQKLKRIAKSTPAIENFMIAVHNIPFSEKKLLDNLLQKTSTLLAALSLKNPKYTNAVLGKAL